MSPAGARRRYLAVPAMKAFQQVSLVLPLVCAEPWAATARTPQPATGYLPAPAADPIGQSPRAKEFQERLKAAQGNALELWKLHTWCEAAALTKEQTIVLRAIIKASPEDRKARQLLGHVQVEGKWYESQAKAEEAAERALREEAKRTGKALWRGTLVDPKDLPMLERGLVRSDQGHWVSAQDLERIKNGWVQQDLVWVSPQEAERMEAGLWKCQDQWLTLEEADRYHAALETCWVIPGEKTVLYTTCPREIAQVGLIEMERSISPLTKLFGQAPQQKLAVLMLGNAQLYDEVGAQSVDQGWQLRDLSSLHGAYFAELYSRPREDGFAGGGVCLFDAASEPGKMFGKTFVRHALAQSFAETVDPSPKALALADKENPSKEAMAKAFWDEKLLPDWFRFGAASYVERYAPDTLAVDTHWLFKWSIDNLKRQSGLNPVKDILAFELDAKDTLRSPKMLNQFGLLLAFIVDGPEKKVAAAHAKLVAALQSKQDVAQAVQELEAKLLEFEPQLRVFAGL